MLPSRVAGIELKSARWTTFARHRDFGVAEGVEFHVQIQSLRDSLRPDFLLAYELRDSLDNPTIFIDNALILLDGGGGTSLTYDRPPHRPGDSHHMAAMITTSEGVLTPVFSTMTTCPVAARIIGKNDFHLFKSVGVALSEDPHDLVARLEPMNPASDTMALQFLSISNGGDATETFGVVVRNGSDTALENIVAALVVDERDIVTHAPRRDTVEYLIRRMAPSETVARAGGYAGNGEAKAKPAVYPASLIRGRDIADNDRASGKLRVGVFQLRADSPAMIVGDTNHIHATLNDQHGSPLLRAPGQQHRLHWGLAENNARAFLTDTAEALAKVYARSAGRVKVTAEFLGVTSQVDIIFGPRPVVDTVGIVYDADGGYRRKDGSTTYPQLCRVYRDGRIERDNIMKMEWVDRIRADSSILSPRADSARARLRRQFDICGY